MSHPVPNRTAMALKARALAAAGAAIAFVAMMPGATAHAQGTAQLDPVAKTYTLGRFKYEAPQFDGWRQIANAPDTLQLVYAEQMEGNQINTRCHVVLEVYDLPAESRPPGVAELAEAGRKQLGAKVKDQMVAASLTAPVPGVENVSTYRFLLHGPPEMGSDYYQVYYVALAPDKSQYVVMQVNTKDTDYENQMYFQQFYATLARLKYEAPAGAAAASPSAAAAVPGGAAPASGAAAVPPVSPSDPKAATPPAK